MQAQCQRYAKALTFCTRRDSWLEKKASPADILRSISTRLPMALLRRSHSQPDLPLSQPTSPPDHGNHLHIERTLPVGSEPAAVTPSLYLPSLPRTGSSLDRNRDIESSLNIM